MNETLSNQLSCAQRERQDAQDCHENEIRKKDEKVKEHIRKKDEEVKEEMQEIAQEHERLFSIMDTYRRDIQEKENIITAKDRAALKVIHCMSRLQRAVKALGAEDGKETVDDTEQENARECLQNASTNFIQSSGALQDQPNRDNYRVRGRTDTRDEEVLGGSDTTMASTSTTLRRERYSRRPFI